ncbi:MAG: prolipoprotein diacylglyceryl transferase [Candidatus Gracilibacteria bacterium]|nr:prolipoprotein diacylglyceryl transferase [Candidatus Gracilibacteria bacterium]
MTIFNIELFGITIAPSYYGLMYALGFIFGYWLIKNRIYINKKNILKPSTDWKIGDFMDSLLFYIFFGVVIGGRLGYVIFYNFSNFLSNPLDILKVWEGGMSFHGGIIGVTIAMILFSKRQKISFYKLADQVSLVVPIGLGLGRIGNYLNKELLGFGEYYGPLAVKTNSGSYFPSPLVELFLEGIVLFIILNLVYKYKKLKNGQIASLLLILYGIFRILVEAIFREPDAHIGYILNYFTLGEIYSLPMIIIGIYFYIKLGTKKS